jgi:hypothetical protein
MKLSWVTAVGLHVLSACGGDSTLFTTNRGGAGHVEAGTSGGGANGDGGRSGTGGIRSSGGFRSSGGATGTGGRDTGGTTNAGGRGDGGATGDGGQRDGGAGTLGTGGGGAGGASGSGGAGGASTGGASSGGANGTGGGSDGGGPVTYPNCAAWKNAGANTNGLRSVDPDGAGPIEPFHVYCTGMPDGAGPARDYLELPHNEDNGWPARNVATFAKVGSDACTCTESLTSHFTKVLMRTGDLTLMSNDRTFAVYNSDPACYVGDTRCEGEKIGYGNGEDCRGIGAAGTANIDLGGTPFHIAPTASFAEYGYLGNGSVTVSVDRKQANVIGGGFCGGYGPSMGELVLEQD